MQSWNKCINYVQREHVMLRGLQGSIYERAQQVTAQGPTTAVQDGAHESSQGNTDQNMLVIQKLVSPIFGLITLQTIFNFISPNISITFHTNYIKIKCSVDNLSYNIDNSTFKMASNLEKLFTLHYM